MDSYANSNFDGPTPQGRLTQDRNRIHDCELIDCGTHQKEKAVDTRRLSAEMAPDSRRHPGYNEKS
jgi:hypothetical protein